MGQKGNVRWSDREWSDMGQDDMGQDDMEQIKKEEIEIDISEVEALPSSLDIPPEVTNMGEIKEEETKMSISKKKDLDGSFTTSEMHPRAPGTHVPVQRVQSVRGHPGSQNLWIPADSMAGPSSGSRLPASKEAHGGGGVRMEPYPAEAGLTLLRVPSSEYSPCEPLVKLPGQRSDFIPSTPPASPGLSMRLPHLRRQEPREQAAEGYYRRSPMYSGGKHTSASPMQPMEPLLPDPNMVGMGTVGTRLGE
ncbi:uncharacterized protein LOC121338358 [Onychostruthus taczanowskii]|uniref:uncharacterized protein LOC121338358 n=1 Tax=Onychostruthus taczanowskii TaxID=356909 RepID=UPI001B80D0D5|nr:uncharacterized protein LOC121338358 [Onychostruthus taczanowskii]